MKGKIVLVPFPFDDLIGFKVRPALCLSNEISIYNHIVICFITSQIENANEHSDLNLLITDVEFDLTGLKVSSAVRLHRMITIPKSLIKRELGILPERYRDAVHSKIRDLLLLNSFSTKIQVKK